MPQAFACMQGGVVTGLSRRRMAQDGGLWGPVQELLLWCQFLAEPPELEGVSRRRRRGLRLHVADLSVCDAHVRHPQAAPSHTVWRMQMRF